MRQQRANEAGARRRAHRRVGAVLAVASLALEALALGALAGCGGTASPVTQPVTQPAAPGSRPAMPRTITVSVAPLPRGVHLSFVQQRIDEGTPRSQVRVANGNPEPVHVVAVGVDWAGYPLRMHRVDYDVPGQQIVDLRYLLPPAVCTPAAGEAPIFAVARTRSRTIRQPMAADGKRYLDRLWRTECEARRIAQAVRIGYGDTWRVSGTGPTSVLHGRLVLTRRAGEEPVAVTQVEGSVLFDLKLADGPGLAAGETQVGIPLEVSTGGRCDPHSLGQSTQTFLFRVFVRLGDGDQIGRLVVPTTAQQQRLLRFLKTACAGAS